jgi:hypothetical protein
MLIIANANCGHELHEKGNTEARAWFGGAHAAGVLFRRRRKIVPLHQWFYEGPGATPEPTCGTRVLPWPVCGTGRELSQPAARRQTGRRSWFQAAWSGHTLRAGPRPSIGDDPRSGWPAGKENVYGVRPSPGAAMPQCQSHGENSRPQLSVRGCGRGRPHSACLVAGGKGRHAARSWGMAIQ